MASERTLELRKVRVHPSVVLPSAGERFAASASGCCEMTKETAKDFLPFEKPVCDRCGSENTVKVREEWGRPGQWNYSWLESWCCRNCGRAHIPEAERIEVEK